MHSLGTAPIRLLFTVATCLFLLGVSPLPETQAVVFSGYYAVTDSNYDGYVAVYFAHASGGLLEHYRLGESVSGPMMCMRQCLQFPSCRSITINTDGTSCYVQSFDRCQKPTETLVQSVGWITYDVRPDTDPDLPSTCFSRCISDTNTTCTACGRPNCWGSACDTCPAMCWDLRPNTPYRKWVVLWPSMKYTRSIICMGPWHSMTKDTFGGLYTRSTFELSEAVVLWLQIVVYYSDGSVFNSFYDYFNVANTLQLSVGHYIGGNAGNFWQAPFSNRYSFAHNFTNCRPFYYANSTCHANGIMSFNEQVEQNITMPNATVASITSLAWEPCVLTTNTSVTNFEFFVSNNMTLLEQTKANNSTLPHC